MTRSSSPDESILALSNTLASWSASDVNRGGEQSASVSFFNNVNIEGNLNDDDDDEVTVRGGPKISPPNEAMSIDSIVEPKEPRGLFGSLASTSTNDNIGGSERGSGFFADFHKSDSNTPEKKITVTKRGESSPVLEAISSSKHDPLDDKKYKLYVVPKSKADIARICFKLIGSGSTICVNKNCRRNHHGGPCPVIPNEAYVQKEKGKIFATPSIDLDLVAPDIATTWGLETKSLFDWRNIMDITKNASMKRDIINKNVPLSENNLVKEYKSTQFSLAHKTPKKRKLKSLIKTEEDRKPLTTEDLKSIGTVDDVKILLLNALLEVNEQIKNQENS